MAQLIQPTVPDVRDIVLDAAGTSLSGLLIEPRHTPPRALVVAVHGGGMRAGYFHGQTHPTQSLMTLGARLGFTVLAVDRPGYGLSAARFPEGQTLAEQSHILHAALAGFARTHDTGAGTFLMAHSYGGKLALHAAADDRGADLIGLDISGISHRYAVDVRQFQDFHGLKTWPLHWGKLALYPPGTFRQAKPLVTPMPPREAGEARRWAEEFPRLAARVTVPVRFTFAEHEGWWHHDDETLASMRRLLSAAPRAVFDRQPNAGHNISLGWAARSYHLRALAFVEECLMEREVPTPVARVTTLAAARAAARPAPAQGAGPGEGAVPLPPLVPGPRRPAGAA
ncbi:alpha/beta hydrolase [Streptomyces eurocidicus]|uniref:Pimeloyl-ACP methyl ester carboxylesterase n=1 Tax=Streptomyces eurocidicus TaxID=66423 RepID=A0A7W8BCA1_STREU|nr:alpha/beta fold hydrolase [Streptomyces eurocidicus]MBB5119218.1 pimeloyl-ACP methyl ester carboxylesterase [Streptomyces eurocidicus]